MPKMNAEVILSSEMLKIPMYSRKKTELSGKEGQISQKLKECPT